MNYKSIFKDQKTRFRILKKLNWIPDSIMLRIQYRIKMGFWPNFRHPKRFTEKLQLYKMKYRNPIMSLCVDKYEVRKYVEGKGLGTILNTLYGVYDGVDDVDFNVLPNKFVVKSTSGGGGLNVILVKDKESCDLEGVRKKMRAWSVHRPGSISSGREWAYTDAPRTRFVIEEYLEDSVAGNALTDYKFFCFNGEPRFLYVITGRKQGEFAVLGVYDLEFNKLPVVRCDEHSTDYVVPKPKNYDKMVDVARKLSADFPHVRVDLYNVDGVIYFGELTFYDGSGYFHYDPDKFDFEAGSYFTEY